LNGVGFDGFGLVDSSGAGAILVSRASRRLRRELRPLVWMVLEEVALDAECENGRLIARTSARQVAEGLGIDPGTAAGALRALCQKGVLALERESGVAGRFGLAVYVVAAVDGLIVARPCARIPGVVEPHMGQPLVAAPDAVDPVAEHPTVATVVSNNRAVSAAPNGDAKTREVRRESVGQGALDLGLGAG
jgi:hypothetical protein